MKSPRRPPLDVEWAFVAVLAATKAADVVTTFVGLRFEPAVHEANPVAAAAMDALGVPLALFALGAAAVVVVTVVTEAVAATLAVDVTTPPWGPTAVKLTGYGLASTVHVAIAARNAVLIAGV